MYVVISNERFSKKSSNSLFTNCYITRPTEFFNVTTNENSSEGEKVDKISEQLLDTL